MLNDCLKVKLPSFKKKCLICFNQGFGSRWISVKLYVMLKQFLLFYEFYDFSCRRYSLMNRPCYNNLFQFMQHDNFRNLNRVISIHWIHLESWVKAFWYCFRVIKKYTFHYLKNSVPIRGNQSSFKILQLFDIWRYQSLVILFFSCVVILM